MILELVFIRSGDFKFSDSRDSICPCLKLNLLFSFFVLANLYHFLLCALRVRAHSKYKYSTQTSGSETTTTLSTFFSSSDIGQLVTLLLRPACTNEHEN